MLKRFVMAPGPTPIPPEVLAVASMPIIHHRTPAFQEIFKNVCEGLQKFFRTKCPVVTFASVGTGGMESAISNLTSPGEKILVASCGNFGERWAEIGKAYGLQVEDYEAEWGMPVDPAEVAKRLKVNPDIKIVYTTLNETSTGVLSDIQTITKVVHDAGALIVVDAISGLGAAPFETDAWGVDVVISGSQKGFMIPPGLAFVALSPAALLKAKTSKNPKFYFNYELAVKMLTDGKMPDTPFTSAVSLILQLQVALDQIHQETMPRVWARHESLAKATRAAATALGLKLVAPTAPSPAITSIWAPEGVSGSDIVKMFRDTYGITIAGGQGKLKGKAFRIGHLGYADGSDILLAIARLEMILTKLNHKTALGTGVKAAQEVLLHENL
jgi:aspartate aminotransferase-like enzyme